MKQYFEETGAGKAFFELLRAGLWGHVPEQAFFMDLKPDDWRQILGMAQKQAVLGLIYAGVSRLPKPLMPGQQTVLRLYGLAEQIRRKNKEIATVTREICGWFEEAGLEPIVLKGQSVGAFYADPDLRQPGDLDLFFHRDYERVIPILSARGITVELSDVHDHFTYKGIPVELHHKPFLPLYPISDLDFSPMERSDVKFPYGVLNLRAAALLYLLHPAKHFMIEGLGLRHVCDWAVFCRYYADRQELNQAILDMQKQGAECFVFALLKIVDQYLGFRLDGSGCFSNSVTDQATSQMLHLILERGNFGYEGKHMRNSREWFQYYWDLWCYIWKSYPFWKIYFWKIMPRRVAFRLNKIICGRKLETQ